MSETLEPAGEPAGACAHEDPRARPVPPAADAAPQAVAPDKVTTLRAPQETGGPRRRVLEDDLQRVLEWVSRHASSHVFPELFHAIWLYLRLDDDERAGIARQMRLLGDARFGPNRDAASPRHGP